MLTPMPGLIGLPRSRTTRLPRPEDFDKYVTVQVSRPLPRQVVRGPTPAFAAAGSQLTCRFLSILLARGGSSQHVDETTLGEVDASGLAHALPIRRAFRRNLSLSRALVVGASFP